MKKRNFIIVCKNIQEIKITLKPFLEYLNIIDFSYWLEQLSQYGSVHLIFYYSSGRRYYGGTTVKDELYRYEQNYDIFNASTLIKPKFIEVKDD